VLARIGALGDIHAEDEALVAALSFLRSQRLDAIVATGDITDGLGDADRCCALLQDHGVLAVRGNHDRWFLEGSMRGLDVITKDLSEPNRRWLSSLPATRRFETPLGPLLLCHGIGEDDMSVLKSDTDAYTLRWLTALTELQRDPDVELMLAGHTHERMVRKLELPSNSDYCSKRTRRDTGPDRRAGAARGAHVANYAALRARAGAPLRTRLTTRLRVAVSAPGHEGLTAINAGTLHRDCGPGFLVVDLEARAVLAYDLRDGTIRPAEPYTL